MIPAIERKLRWWLLKRPRFRLRYRLYLAAMVPLGLVSHQRSKGPFPRWRYWIHTLWTELVFRVLPKPRRDCRAHHWYKAFHGLERCRYCEAGVRPLRAQWTDEWREAVELSRELMLTDTDFYELVEKAFEATDFEPLSGTGEALVLALWLGYAELGEA